jgi:ElaB/YqjD/DUF883 family membrane-anchored ribosome-binding protein
MTEISASSLNSGEGSTSDRAGDNRALKEKVHAVKDAAADLAGEFKRYASHRASEAKDVAGEWVDTAKAKAVDYNEMVIDYVQRNPYKAVAIAAGIGFLAGLILKRR